MVLITDPLEGFRHAHGPKPEMDQTKSSPKKASHNPGTKSKVDINSIRMGLRRNFTYPDDETSLSHSSDSTAMDQMDQHTFGVCFSRSRFSQQCHAPPPGAAGQRHDSFSVLQVARVEEAKGPLETWLPNLNMGLHDQAAARRCQTVFGCTAIIISYHLLTPISAPVINLLWGNKSLTGADSLPTVPQTVYTQFCLGTRLAFPSQMQVNFIAVIPYSNDYCWTVDMPSASMNKVGSSTGPSRGRTRPSKRRITFLLGLVLLLTAFTLLVVVDATAPVSPNLALYTISWPYKSTSVIGGTTVHPSIRMGTFGFCTAANSDETGQSTDTCSRQGIGYDPTSAMDEQMRGLVGDSTEAFVLRMTKIMAIRPLVAALAFLAFALASMPCYFVPSLPVVITAVTCILVLVVLVCDFVIFSRLSQVVAGDYNTVVPSYDTGLWALVAALVCLVISCFILTFFWWQQRRMEGKGKTVHRDAPESENRDITHHDQLTLAASRHMDLGSKEAPGAFAGTDGGPPRAHRGRNSKTVRITRN
ncbi:putative Pali-domain-containing protein [Seiridium cardinale]